MKRRHALVALAASPLLAYAQRKPARVLVLSVARTDFLDGAGIAVDARSADGRLDRLEALAAQAVRARPDVIVAQETAAVLAAAKATQRIPIVMAPASERVAGGNITGLVVDRARQSAGVINLVRDLKSNARRIALLANADDAESRALLASLNQAAARIRVPVGIARVRTAEDYEAAFEQWERLRLQAVIVAPTADAKRAAELALRYRVPAVSLASGFVDAGGLASYAASARETARRTATYVERILKGARPRELPVEPIGAFDLALNLRTARALEMELPEGLLARADALIQ